MGTTIRAWIDPRAKTRGSSRKKISDRLGNINPKEIDANNIELRVYPELQKYGGA